MMKNEMLLKVGVAPHFCEQLYNAFASHKLHRTYNTTFCSLFDESVYSLLLRGIIFPVDRKAWK